MTRARLNLTVFYGLVAIVALAATWSQNLFYFQGGHGPADGLMAFVRFVTDTRVNPATRSVTVDLALVCLAAMTFMILEARRLGIRYVWAYVALGFLVAISVTLPLFLIARERHIAWQEGGEISGLAVADAIGIAATSAVVAALGTFILG